MSSRANDGLAGLVSHGHIVICCGSGGVGKTTTAAVIALQGARRGRNAVVVTIDPAKRLANALGLDELSNSAHEIDRRHWSPDDPTASGRLSALMLDTKTTFDGLVTRYAGDEDQAGRILDNRFYRNVSSALGGTQEYMAMEKLNELHEEGGFDLIVVDTPPTRHALDFLDAPKRITRLLDNRIFRLLMMPTRASLRVAGVAVAAFLKTVGRVIGSAVIDDIIAFFRAFEGMEEGFRERAATVLALLEDGNTRFVLITAPQRDAVTESVFFANQIATHGLSVDALIVNRMHPSFGDEDAAGLRARAEHLHTEPGPSQAKAAAQARERLAAQYENLADFSEIGARELTHLEAIRARIGAAPVSTVPFLAQDVHDFAALSEIGDQLFRGAES